MARAKRWIRVLESQTTYSFEELTIHTGASTEFIKELIAYGVLTPLGMDVEEWKFPLDNFERLKLAIRLQHDLDLNIAGVAMALDLLEELHQIRQQLKDLEGCLKQFHHEL